VDKKIDSAALAFDQQHIWHPYSSMLSPPPVYPVVAAAGTRLTLADGRELVDGMSSWWSAIHGYNQPRLNGAAHRQLDRFAHVMFGGLTHLPAIELCRRLVEMTPAPLSKVFLSDSGSVAVEVALKMAVQYWQARQRPEKHKLVALRGGYHGDTCGAMAVCDPVTGMHEIFSQVLPRQFFVPRPQCRFAEAWDENDIKPLAELLAAHHQEIAALILEPIVQGAGGMWFYSPHYLRRARELCDTHDILLIADEIATGFGRTGKMFACEHGGIVPDILCLGKALTGGYLSLAATLTTATIAETISAGGAGCFMHGPTFMGNPLACRVACESIDLLLASPWQERIKAIAGKLSIGLAGCRELAVVKDVRVLGAIGVIELHEAPDHRALQQRFVDQLVWIRPFGRLIYLMPAYIIGEDDLDYLIEKVVAVVGEL
jgi:adenosylmethionine-8-amino-7-oxononanoate aminotransferase